MFFTCRATNKIKESKKMVRQNHSEYKLSKKRSPVFQFEFLYPLYFFLLVKDIARHSVLPCCKM